MGNASVGNALVGNVRWEHSVSRALIAAARLVEEFASRARRSRVIFSSSEMAPLSSVVSGICFVVQERTDTVSNESSAGGGVSATAVAPLPAVGAALNERWSMVLGRSASPARRRHVAKVLCTPNFVFCRVSMHAFF